MQSMRNIENRRLAARFVTVPWARFLVVIVAVAGLFGCGSDDPSQAPFQVSVLSSRPDMISGGDALVEVKYPDTNSQQDISIRLNGTDVTSQFSTQAGAERTMRGLVSGLTTDPTSATGSPNTLTVVNLKNASSRLDVPLVNYPITGPILSGPHIKPYECRTVENGLGQPLDADCSVSRQVVWYYRASDRTFKPLANPTGPRPADLVTTTTNAGVTVPYIVRVESGTINRGVYRLAILDDPKQPAGASFTPSASWNGKLIVAFGGGAFAQYNQGVQPISLPVAVTPDKDYGCVIDTCAVTSVLANRELSRGFALMMSTELVNNQHANPHLQGETLMMLKEHFIKHIGVPKWTAGTGLSGGSIQQYLIAQLYPRLLDGIQPYSSFPETLMPEFMECRLLNNVYKSDLSRWTLAKQDAINGFNTGTCTTWDTTLTSNIKSDYAPGCGLTQQADVDNIFNRTTNPGGTRCDLFQTNVNLLGTRPGTNEARRPFDNVGMQYGLGALNSGAISVQEFLDMNASVGGFDGDGNPQTTRTQADLDALRLSYEGGLKNSFQGPGLSNIPILTWRENADGKGDIHDLMQDLIVRARLQRANGRADNQVIWESGSTSHVDVGAVALDTMNAWLDAIQADPAAPSIDKVVRLKPPAAVDGCWNAQGQRINEPMSADAASACNKLYPRFSTPRIVAGGPIENDVLKCQLKALDPADYKVALTPTQMAQLKAIFPSGVCDWTKPGVNQNALRGTYLRLPIS
jgi:hypothetical protein